MDIYWRDAHKCPTEEEYKTMVIRSKYLLIILVYFSAHGTRLFFQYFTLCKRLFSYKIDPVYFRACPKLSLKLSLTAHALVYSDVPVFQKLVDFSVLQ